MPLLGKKAKETPGLRPASRDKLLIYHDAGSPNIVDPKLWVEEAQRRHSGALRYNIAMKILTAKVVDGRLQIPDGVLEDGAVVTLLVPEVAHRSGTGTTSLAWLGNRNPRAAEPGAAPARNGAVLPGG